MIRYPCPTRGRLLYYSQGRIEEGEAERISIHLVDCEHCAAELDDLCHFDDTLLASLRLLGESGTTVLESSCTQGLQELERLLIDFSCRDKDRLQLPPPYDASNPSAPRENLNSQGIDFSPSSSDDGTVEMIRRLITLQHQQASAAGMVLDAESPPLQFGDYTVLEPIGKGGMGIVYKVRHRYMDRIVALKVLTDSRPRDSDSVRYFEREVRIAAQLIHPNIVRSYDAGVADGARYLVMELIEGRTLSQIVKQEGPLSIRQACNYIQQAARGLAAAHSLGIVHRDIKPSNLIVDGDGVVKVLDMGVARIRDSDLAESASHAEQTMSGALLGTVDYMAPEQARDAREATAKSDVYGLGCSFYHLLTGEKVFPGQSVIERIAAHCDQPSPTLQTRRNDVPLEVEALVGRMLAKQPEQRPTMTEVIDLLNRFSASPSDSTEPITPSLTSFEGKPPRARQVLIAAAAAGAAFLFGIWVFVKDREGRTIASVQVPDDGAVEVTGAPPASQSNDAHSKSDKRDGHAAGHLVDAAQVGLICDLLAAKRKPMGLTAHAIPFEGPAGDGRDGANGLVVAAPTNWESRGTQWTFQYRRSAGAEGMIIIHPFRSGHFRVVVNSTGAFLSRGGPWGSDGFHTYGQSDGKLLVARENVGSAWPLRGDQLYRIESRCDGGGGYELEVDGKVVCSTTVSEAKPQTMKPPFEDMNCPQTLLVGQAALILGPTERGVHEVSNAFLDLSER